MSRHIKYNILAIVAAAMMLVGCRSTEKPASGTNLAGATLNQRYDALVAASGQWKQINVPVRIDLKQPASVSLSGRAYMRRGDDIYISLRMLGFEVATAYINRDSVFAADKVNRRYIVEPISAVLGSLYITLDDIQDAITGRVFVLSRGTVSNKLRSEVALDQHDGYWSITPRNIAMGTKYDFDISDSDNTLKAINIDYKGRKVTCSYSGPEQTDRGTFMSQARIATQLKDKSIDAGIRWTWGSAKFTVDPSVKWRTPSGYTRLDAQSLLKILSSF